MLIVRSTLRQKAKHDGVTVPHVTAPATSTVTYRDSISVVVLIVALGVAGVSAGFSAGEFPKPFRLSDSGRAKGWDEDETIEWQAQRMASRERGETAKPELNLSKARDKARSDPLKKRARHRRELPPAEARLTEKQRATSNATSGKLEALEDTSSGEMLTAFREQPAFPDTS